MCAVVKYIIPLVFLLANLFALVYSVFKRMSSVRHFTVQDSCGAVTTSGEGNGLFASMFAYLRLMFSSKGERKANNSKKSTPRVGFKCYRPANTVLRNCLILQ